jgi:hypothetical protein
MSWDIRSRRSKDARQGAPLVWWVRQSEAERVIKALRKRVRELEGKV